MKIGELFNAREAAHYPTREELLDREIASARASHPNATSDLEALAFAASNLRRSLADRTHELRFARRLVK